VMHYRNDLNQMKHFLTAVIYNYSSRIQVSFTTDSVLSPSVHILRNIVHDEEWPAFVL
jgi:hypothetical protein